MAQQSPPTRSIASPAIMIGSTPTTTSTCRYIWTSRARTGGPILELACGSGRLMAPLLELGEGVVGLDSSAPMLERARQSLEGDGLMPRAGVPAG